MFNNWLTKRIPSCVALLIFYGVNSPIMAYFNMAGNSKSLNILEMVKTGMLCFFEDILISTF